MASGRPGPDGERGDSASVLLRLSDEDVHEAEKLLGEVSGASVRTLSTNQAFRELRAGGSALRSCEHLGVVGDPPTDCIGYSLAPVLAALGGPGKVTLIDRRYGTATTQPLKRYLAGATPAAGAQVVGSTTAVAAQRVLAEWLLLKPQSSFGLLRRPLLRVLYIRPLVGIPASVGGSVSHTHGVIRAFRELGVEVDPLTNDPSIARTAASDPDPPCAWDVVDAPRPLKAVPASMALGDDLAITHAGRTRARTSDILYQRHARFSLVGALLARLTRRPLFLEYNGSEAFFDSSYHSTPLGGQLRLCEQAILASAARVIVTSQVDHDDLVHRGIPPERIVINPNGVDAERFGQGGGREVRERLGFGGRDRLIGFVGSFGPWHGAPALAKAFRQVAASNPDARLLLLGDGPDRPTVTRLLTLAGLTDRAVFVGKVPPSEVPGYLDACDILASPHVPLPGGTAFFGSPTKLFEYMAAGKGIVASKLGQIGEVLEHERNAIMVVPGDVSELAAGIERLLNHPRLASKLGAQARRDAIDRHSWRRNAQRVIESYEELSQD